MLSRQAIKHHKTSIVAGKRVLWTNVAQTNNQKFHKQSV